jgi:hypothetical protein
MAGRAGLVYRVAAQNGGVAAGLVEQVFFGVAAAFGGHLGQDGFGGLKHLGNGGFGQVAHFALGVDFGRPENILQHAVAQAGDALLGGEEGFG